MDKVYYYFNMNRIQKIFFIMIFAFLCFSCQHKEVVEEQNIDIEPQTKPAQDNVRTKIPLWIPGDYAKVALVFGHGYETPDAQQPVLAVLEENFGHFRSHWKYSRFLSFFFC
jgi:hypothetical protein